MTVTIDHWQGLADFARLDKLSGGPDSHMKTVVRMYGDFDEHNPLWAAGVYVSVYNVPMAQILLHEFPDPRRLDGLDDWLLIHWPGVTLRRERKRPVGSPKKLAACLHSLAHFLTSRGDLNVSYDDAWQQTDQIKYFGRYAKMKFLETARQLGFMEEMIPDIRADGGWSPREGLVLLNPSEWSVLEDGGRNENPRVEELANQTYDRLRSEYGSDMNRYEFQVFLCDYKQCVVGHRQYPGRSLDSELDHMRKVRSFFTYPWMDGVAAYFMATRQDLFPAWALGELNDWTGVREELGDHFAKTGVMWTDSAYKWGSDASKK